MITRLMATADEVLRHLMSERQFTERFGRVRVVSLAKRPDVPDNWVIMNAPRPLRGTRLLSDMRNPQPYAKEGNFVVAINPQDPDAALCIATNRSLDACVLVFVPDALLRQMGAAYSVAYARTESVAQTALNELAEGETSNLLAVLARECIEAGLTPGSQA